MASKKLIIYNETLPYHNLFTLNKIWLDLKQQRLELVEQIREIRAKGYNITLEINEIEEKISKAIVKLDKKND
jgi:hypothetical protein